MNRLDKLFLLLNQITEKQQKLMLMYGKDGKMMEDIGVTIMGMIFDEIGFRYSEKITNHQIVAKELFSIVNLYIHKRISKEQCIQKLNETQKMYEYLEEKKNKYQKNGIYTVRSGDGVYQIVKVNHFDLQHVYIAIFRERFETRPNEIHLGDLHVEFENIPIPETTFDMWDPLYVLVN